MKAHPKHIDWGKVVATQEIMDGYVMPKYGKTNWMEDDSLIDIIVDDIYDTFYKDEEKEANAAKASEDMKLSIMKEKFLAIVESEKARIKDYTKLVVTDGMVDYVLEKYGNKWKSEDEIAYVILDDLWLKYGKYNKGKGKLVEDNRKGKEAEHHHLKVNKDDKGKRKLEEDNGKEKEAEHHHLKVNKDDKGKKKLVEDSGKGNVDDHDDDLDSLDLENRIKKLKEDFGRLLKAKKAKESKKANEAKKVREAKKAREAELAKQSKKARKAKLKAKEAKKAKEAMLADVVQISSDEDDDKDPTAPLPQDPELLLPPLPQDSELLLPPLSQDPELPLSPLPQDLELLLHLLLMHKLLPMLQKGTRK
ncbi:hypothetical protein Tco_1211555 [Tanacetum coccineum]